jgi:hypothetical protein
MCPSRQNLLTVAPEQSTAEEKPRTETTTETVPTSIPEPSFVQISIAPSTTTQNTGASVFTTPPHVALPRWTGTGELLQGYCATPDYTMIDGPTAYWAPVVGCAGMKPDCCPFDIAPSTMAVAAALDTTLSTASPVPADTGKNRGFPSAISPAQSTLSICPADYRSIGDGCCPS